MPTDSYDFKEDRSCGTEASCSAILAVCDLHNFHHGWLMQAILNVLFVYFVSFPSAYSLLLPGFIICTFTKYNEFSEGVQNATSVGLS